MTEPVISLIDQLEETRTPIPREQEGSQGIVSRLYFPEDRGIVTENVPDGFAKDLPNKDRVTKTFKLFFFFENIKDFELFKTNIIMRNISVECHSRQVTKENKFFDRDGYLLILTLNDEDRQKIIDEMPNNENSGYITFTKTTISKEIHEMSNDIGLTIMDKGNLTEMEYRRLGKI